MRRLAIKATVGWSVRGSVRCPRVYLGLRGREGMGLIEGFTGKGREETSRVSQGGKGGGKRKTVDQGTEGGTGNIWGRERGTRGNYGEGGRYC